VEGFNPSPAAARPTWTLVQAVSGGSSMPRPPVEAAGKHTAPMSLPVMARLARTLQWLALAEEKENRRGKPWSGSG
jgi:hypothetical protein